MAEIKVNIKGDNADFKKKMDEARVSSIEFAGKLREGLLSVKETAGEVAGESGLGKIANMLGMAGLTGAAIAFGGALVEAIKSGVEEAAKLEAIGAKLSTFYGGAFGGKQLTEWATQHAGIGGTAEQIASGFHELGPANLGVQGAQNLMSKFLTISAGGGESVEELSKFYAEGAARNWQGMSRLLRAHPGLETAFNKFLPGWENQQMTAQQVGNVFTQMSTPGSSYAVGAQEFSQTGAGKMMELSAAFDRLKEAVGGPLLDSLKPAMDDLIKTLPTLSTDAEKFGIELAKATEGLIGFAKQFATTGDKVSNNPMIKGEREWEQSIFSQISKWFSGGSGDPLIKSAEALSRSADHSERAAKQLEGALNDL